MVRGAGGDPYDILTANVADAVRGGPRAIERDGDRRTPIATPCAQTRPMSEANLVKRKVRLVGGEALAVLTGQLLEQTLATEALELQV